jgi:hypothetical protein
MVLLVIGGRLGQNRPGEGDQGGSENGRLHGGFSSLDPVP